MQDLGLDVQNDKFFEEVRSYFFVTGSSKRKIKLKWFFFYLLKCIYFLYSKRICITDICHTTYNGTS